MICIIFAPPRTGKTCFLTHILISYMFDNERNWKMKKELNQKQANGFEYIKTIPQHCVFSNYPIVGKKYKYSNRLSHFINPFKIGFHNDLVETYFTPPYSVFGITEAQEVFNSRKSMYFPDWQSRFFEQGGHNYCDFFLDAQRADLIDLNIRELSHFVEIVKLDKKYDKNDKIISLTWTIRHIENNSLYERYISSVKKDNSCYKQMTVTADYNVFECYDSCYCKPKFYEGHFYEDFNYLSTELTENTFDGYIKFLKENDYKMPQEYYQKRSVKK